MVLFFHASFVSLHLLLYSTLLYSTLLYSTLLYSTPLFYLSHSPSPSPSPTLSCFLFTERGWSWFICYEGLLATNALNTSYTHSSFIFLFFLFFFFFLISLLILNIPERKVYWSILGTFQFEKSKFITYQLRTNLAKGSIYVLGKLAETRQSLLIECKLQQYPQNKQKKKKRKKGRKKRRKRRREEKRK